MATTSVIAAVMTKIDGLTAANFPGSSRPAVYLDQAPQASAGTQIRPGYLVLRDAGQTPAYLGFEGATNEVCEFELDVIYPDSAGGLGAVDTACAAIKFNGGSKTAYLGLDLGTLSDLSAPRSTHQILRTKERRWLAGYDADGRPVHACTLSYRVTVLEAA